MKISLLATTLVSMTLLAAACATETTTPAPPVANDSHIEANRESVTEVGDVNSTTTIEATRGVQRMPITILEASIPIVAGSHVAGGAITWKDGKGEALADNVFGAVLGRPDYITVTEENPAPSSLYVKFMRDMARDVCTRIVSSDTQRAAFGDTTLWRFAPVDGSASDEQINENLRYLVLRFLGMRLDSDDAYITQLRAVFDAGRDIPGGEWAGVEADTEGWRSVCIGLLESPAFHID
jgi:hypothetical protein